MPEKQTNKERLKDITDSIEKGIQELFQSDKYAQYLRTMSRVHRYSVNNQMLIYMQKPDATLVAGFNKWRDQFERNVMKGEKGIKIIAPTPFKKKIEEQKLDPDTKLPMLDADGKVIMEEKEIKIPMFKPVTVFDVSQTDGKPLPQLASDLTGDVQNYEVFMEALRRSSPVPIDFKPIADNADGFFSLDDQSITIREGMSEIQTVSAVVHEIAHSKLHNNKKIEEPKNAPSIRKSKFSMFQACFPMDVYLLQMYRKVCLSTICAARMMTPVCRLRLRIMWLSITPVLLSPQSPLTLAKKVGSCSPKKRD